jgi:hypothetical protein
MCRWSNTTSRRDFRRQHGRGRAADMIMEATLRSEFRTDRRYSVYKDRIRSPASQRPTGSLATLREDIWTRLDGTRQERGHKLEHLLQRALSI